VSSAAHAAHPETTTGIDNRKLAIWTFIGSECLFFATLISVYLVNKDRSVSGPTGADIFEIPLITFGTAVLLFSSFFVVLALNGAQRGDRKKLITWLSLTVVAGLFFVGMQVYEFQYFASKGLGFGTNIFASSFYVLTGFHGTHVTIGVLWLATLLVLAIKGKLPAHKALNLEIAALYWHFVDVVWIVIFPVVYLMS
jgi:cytochrome c oxidase subunit 3/cytochrome o ubiquinol oxidase subunit 3